MSELDNLIPEFIAECEEAVSGLQIQLDELPNAKSPEQRVQILDAVFRAVHTLKGGAGMFGFQKTVERSHALEALINSARQENRALTHEQIEHIRHESRVLLEMIQRREQESAPGTAVTTPAAADSAGYIRVPVPNVINANKLISEIFLVRNQVLFLIERLKGKDLDIREFLHEWDSLDSAMRRNLRDLSRVASSMQMTTAKHLFDRMKTVVDGYKAKTGKKINVETHGESTELDKKVVDVLGEPLIHLIRNAIDHGIETPDARIKAGKPEQGHVKIEARAESNQVVITVEDDGRGMDPARILAKAQEKGIDTQNLKTTKEILNLIMLPGFSTAEKVTEISGRGVGMDAVKASVQKIGGQIDIDTHLGQGSQFRIQIPLAVSVSPVLIFEVAGQIYAVPSSEVSNTQRRPLTDLRPHVTGSCLQVDENFYPCMDLQKVFHTDCEPEFTRLIQVINLKGGGCVKVTNLIENTELVIKPIPPVFPRIPFVTGLSLLPTGQPVFVVSLKRAYEGWSQSSSTEESSSERVAA